MCLATKQCNNSKSTSSARMQIRSIAAFRTQITNLLLSLAATLLLLLNCCTPTTPIASDEPIARVTASSPSGPLVVHIIPHSHCDPGWLSSFGQYYDQDVKQILDGVLRELSAHPQRKFVWSEISFFHRWYEALNNARKSTFQQLVARGQIEFVNGGWVQHDEASPHPTEMLAQITLGHTYLRNNFGVIPKVAWQIDPFGHSAVSPTLFRLLGFEALVINRIHFALKDKFKQQRWMEFFWQGSDLGAQTPNNDVADAVDERDLFTHVLHTHYSAPAGFDWEENAQPVDANNAQQRATELYHMMKQRSTAYRTRHLLVPFGDDFRFKQADRQFQSMDQLMKHWNTNSVSQFEGATIQYSTLSDYFSAVARDSATQRSDSNSKAVDLGGFPRYSGDFFPYADNDDSYWSGYFTTRPLLKAKSRRLSELLRAAEMLHALTRGQAKSQYDSQQQLLPAGYWESKADDIQIARHDTSLFLHHDAITGTSRQQVVEDYQRRMDTSAERLLAIMTRMIEHTMTREPHAAPSLTHSAYTLAMTSPVKSSSSDQVQVHPLILYNSLGWRRTELCTVRVATRFVQVFSSDGATRIAAQVDTLWPDSNAPHAMSTSEFVLHFVCTVPALGATTYFIQLHSQEPKETLTVQSVTKLYLKPNAPGNARGAEASVESKYVEHAGQLADTTQLVLENSHLRVHFSPSTGLMQSMELVGSNSTTASGAAQAAPAPRTIKLEHSFKRYRTSRSGAYLFRPEGRSELAFNSAAQGALQSGAMLRLTQSELVSTLIVRYHEFEIEYQLLNHEAAEQTEMQRSLLVHQTVSIENNFELIAQFASDLKTSDSGQRFDTHNGLGWMRRLRRTVPQHPVASNFYPMVVGARLADAQDHTRLTFLNQHSMACGSTEEGMLEMMLHRCLAQDDGRGLAEPVIDTSRLDVPLLIDAEQFASEDQMVARGEQHMLRHSIRVNNPLHLFYKTSNPSEAILSTASAWLATQLPELSLLQQPLPQHVHVFSLAARDANSDDVAMRLQHLDGSRDAIATQIDTAALFDPQQTQLSELRRTSASFNQRYSLASGRHSQEWHFVRHPSETMGEAMIVLATHRASASVAKGENQNTDEAGVFISQVALLAQRARDAALKLAQQQQSTTSTASSRRLLSSQAVTTIESLYTLELQPLQIQSIVFKAWGTETEKDIAMQQEFDAQHVAQLSNKLVSELKSTAPDTTKSLSEVIPLSPVAVSPAPSAVATAVVAPSQGVGVAQPGAAAAATSSAVAAPVVETTIAPAQPPTPAMGEQQAKVTVPSTIGTNTTFLASARQSITNRARRLFPNSKLLAAGSGRPGAPNIALPSRTEWIVIVVMSSLAVLFYMRALGFLSKHAPAGSIAAQFGGGATSNNAHGGGNSMMRSNSSRQPLSQRASHSGSQAKLAHTEGVADSKLH